MTFHELIQHLQRNDVRLTSDGTLLNYDAPPGIITESLLSELRSYKSQLIAWLADFDDQERVEARTFLTYGQERMWNSMQAHNLPAVYNIAQQLTLTGRIDYSVLERALNLLVERHTALRTRFVVFEGQPVQEILAFRPHTLPLKDLSLLPVSEQGATIEAWCREEAHRGFALDQAPLWRATLIKCGESNWILLVVVQHMICDGWSLEIILREWALFYTCLISGVASKLAPLPWQYRDYAEWEHYYWNNDRIEQHLQFWRQELRGASLTLLLPSISPRPTQLSGRGEVQIFYLHQPAIDALQTIARTYGTTLYAVLLSAFVLWLSHCSGQKDLVLASPVANRSRQEHENMIGLFAQSVLLRARLDQAETFADLIHQMSRTFFAVVDHVFLPANKLADAVQPGRSTQNPPFPQVLFAMWHDPAAAFSLPDVRVELEDIPIDGAHTDLCCVLRLRSDSIVGAMEYPVELFDSATVTCWIANFQQVLERVGKDATHPLAEYM